MNAIRTPQDRDRLTFALAPIDHAFHASEAKWGVGRLERLISHQTLAAYKRGWDAYRAALDDGDGAAVEVIGPKMIAALGVLDREATAAGHTPLSVETWEAPMRDGSVFVMVRTQAEASAVLRGSQGRGEGNLPPDLTLTVRHQHEGRALNVWTLGEIVRLVEAHGGVGAIKEAFPGATIQGGIGWPGTAAPSGVQRDEGHTADVVRSGYPLGEAIA